MRLTKVFISEHPFETLVLVALLLVAGLADSIGLSTLLPLLNLTLHPGAPLPRDGFEAKILGMLDAVHIHLTFVLALLIWVGSVTTRSALVFLANLRIGYLAADTTTELRMRLLRAVMASRWSYFVHQSPGKLSNALATEAWRASQAFVCTVKVLALSIELLVYLWFALLVSWFAALTALLIGVLFVTVLQPIMHVAKRAGKRQTKWNRALLGTLGDTLQSVKAFKAMGRNGLAEDVLSTETGALQEALRGQVFGETALEAAQDPLYVGAAALGLFVAIAYMHVDAAKVLFMMLVLLRLIRQTGKVQKQVQSRAVCESAYWSFIATLNEAEAAQETGGGARLPSLTRDIVFDDVRFAYGDDVLLNHLNLRIPANRLTCLVGISGAGKTTVVDLVVGLHQPAAGKILIDGVDLADLQRDAWRHSIGYVPQENLLLHDTVLHNVTLGNPQLSEQEAETALRAAGAWPFVAALPGGMRAIVGERGTRLSGGERQRIMIARALAHKPKLLILDEATTALDPATERAVCATLLALRGELTILAISHQSELMRVADVVYRLERGTLVDAPEVAAS